MQTFPNVLKAISDWDAKKVAIIIDEAHSSQSGNAAASMNAVFSDSNFDDLERDEEGNVSTEDLVYMLQGLEIETDLDLKKLIQTGNFISSYLGRSSISHLAQAKLNG